MKKALICTLALCLVAFAGGDAEQDTLTAKIAKLEKCAAKGCMKSGAKLAALKKACGTDDLETIKSMALCGDAKQRAKIEAALAAPVKVERPLLSVRLAKFCGYAEKGCNVSRKILASLLDKKSGPEAEKALLDKVVALEEAAARGDKESKVDLAKLEAKVFLALPLSMKVAICVKRAKGGCGKSEAALAPLFKAFETGCCTKLIKGIRALEASAQKGSEPCAKKLAALEAKLLATPRKELATKDSECTECTDCKDCGEGAAKEKKKGPACCPKK